MTTQIMIDLETYSILPNSAIASIGACKFTLDNVENPILDTFYVNVEQSSNKKINRHYHKDTLDWWKTKPLEVKKALMENQVSIEEAITKLCDFIKTENDPKIWSQGTDFDISILKSTMFELNIKEPWKYYNVRCSRTLAEIMGIKMLNYRSPGHHNALQDAIDQAKVVNMILKT